jgi:hypothetical protein
MLSSKPIWAVDAATTDTIVTDIAAAQNQKAKNAAKQGKKLQVINFKKRIKCIEEEDL